MGSRGIQAWPEINLLLMGVENRSLWKGHAWYGQGQQHILVHGIGLNGYRGCRLR